MKGMMFQKKTGMMLLVGVVAVLFTFLAGSAMADTAAAKKWIDEEFQPSTLTKDQQTRRDGMVHQRSQTL